jgi:hypothetical protein
MAGFCEHGNELSDSTKKAGYFLTSSVTISFSNILHYGVSEWVSEWVSKYVSYLKKRLTILMKGKDKLNLSLCLTKHHAMQAYWGEKV